MACPIATRKQVEARTKVRHMMRGVAHRKAVGAKLAASGQHTTVAYQHQACQFGFPAKVVDAETRALIDAALEARRS